MITRQEIEPIVNDIIDERSYKNQYTVSQIPVHTHNGVDSPTIEPYELTNANNYFALKTLTLNPTQIKALHTTPQVLLPSLGVPTLGTSISSIYAIEGITAKIYYGGTQYTGTNALEFRIGDGSGSKVAVDMSTTFLNQSTSVFCHVPGITTEFITSGNPQIVISVPVANPGAGNSNITFTVKYRVISL